MTQKVVIQHNLIRYFNGFFPSGQEGSFDNQKAMIKHGFFVPVQYATDDLKDVVYEKYTNNFNSTFYKNISDVSERDRLELFVEQIIHYVSGGTFIVNETPEISEFCRNIKPLKPLTVYEIQQRVISLLNGAAMKEETITNLVEIFQFFEIDFDINSIKNRQAKLVLYKMLGKFPETAEELLKYVVYLMSNDFSFVKNKKLISSIKKGVVFDGVAFKGKEKDLASIFNRNKSVFVAIKQNATVDGKSVINKISKLSKSLHMPLKKGILDSLSDENLDLDELKERLKTVDNFRKVRMLNSIIKKYTNYKTFFIRNGKLFIKKGSFEKENSSEVFSIIYQSLIDSLSKKKCRVILPKSMKVVLPTSEKNFIGNIPMYSYVEFKNNPIVGIEWDKYCFYRDIDLHRIDLSGSIMGWNRNYSQDDVFYSGDMINVNPLTGIATEKFYHEGKKTKGMYNFNLFNGSYYEGKKELTFFLADKETDEYMFDVNKDEILFSEKIIFDDNSRENTLGILCEDKFVFYNAKSGNSIVTNPKITQKLTDIMKDNIKNNIFLENVLKDAGFEIVDKDADFDFSVLSKDSLISLLS